MPVEMEVDRIVCCMWSHFACGIAEAKCILVTAICVCLSLAAFPHYCTDPCVTWGNGRPLVVHYWVDLQSVHEFRCYENIAPSAKCQSACTHCMPGWFPWPVRSTAVCACVVTRQIRLRSVIGRTDLTAGPVKAVSVSSVAWFEVVWKVGCLLTVFVWYQEGHLIIYLVCSNTHHYSK